MQTTKNPEIVVFAGPNGSGKSTVTRMSPLLIKPYINADNIKASQYCDDIQAAMLAEQLREAALAEGKSFSFETVMSTERNLLLLERAKRAGYFIRGIFVFTRDPQINITRVSSREQSGGHGVPEEKIVSRYHKSIALMPHFIEVCDVCHVYDNTQMPQRIFKKRKTEFFCWPSEKWAVQDIEKLTGTALASE